MNKADLEKIVSSLGGSKADAQCFQVIHDFLEAHPETLSGKKKAVWNSNEEAVVRQICKTYLDAKRAVLKPSTPTTVPDNAVSHILNICYGHPKEDLERIKVEHQHSMAAENAVGSLLERYVATSLENLGWVWCAGDFIKAIDFIRFEKGKWILLQIKNRDNSENSSSSAIRNGTEIEKWFRTFSRTGKTNWDAFPEPNAKKILSEKGFMDYITAYFKASK